jgi:hypothetical protein
MANNFERKGFFEQVKILEFKKFVKLTGQKTNRRKRGRTGYFLQLIHHVFRTRTHQKVNVHDARLGYPMGIHLMRKKKIVIELVQREVGMKFANASKPKPEAVSSRNLPTSDSRSKTSQRSPGPSLRRPTSPRR